MIKKRISTFFLIFFISSLALAQPTKESIELAKKVPIADVHMHTYQQNPRSAAWWTEKMNENNVKWGGAVGDYREDVQLALGERFIAAIGQAGYFRVFFKDGARGLTDPENSVFQDLYARGEKLLQSGKIKGFGEFHTNNSNSGAPRIRRAIRVDNPAMRKFYAIAEKSQGFIQIHSEFDSDFERDILNLSAAYPNVTTILSHCLSASNPNDLSSLFSKRKNITCEMSATGEVINRLLGLNKNPIAFNSSGPFGGWKKLIEAYPDQVMLGTDPCCGADGGYSELVAELRTNLLPYFSPEIIEKLAFKNAVRVFKLNE